MLIIRKTVCFAFFVLAKDTKRVKVIERILNDYNISYSRNVFVTSVQKHEITNFSYKCSADESDFEKFKEYIQNEYEGKLTIHIREGLI